MLVLEGFDTTKQTKELQLPQIGELILFPFCNRIDIHDLYSIANSDLKYLIDQIPLYNNKKYVTVNMTTQILSPKVTAAPRSNWHFDANSFEDDEETHIHLLISDCTATTEFVKNRVILDNFSKNDSLTDVEVFLNHNEEILGEMVKINPNRFITFNGAKHLHRAINSTEFEFRFTMRVMESDDVAPSRDNPIHYQSSVYNDNITSLKQVTKEYVMNNETTRLPSIDKGKETIKLYFN